MAQISVDDERRRRQYRETMSRFPTGVVVISALDSSGAPTGMTVGSFTSVSLEPELVAFLPAKSSSSFPAIRESGSFCVNVLAASQLDVCRAFATKGIDRFGGLEWRPASSGSPIINGAVAWVDCDIEDVIDAGDHYIVVGRVREHSIGSDGQPLVFYQGGYGQFSTPTLTAPGDADLLIPLRMVDICRSEMERLAADTGVECQALSIVGDELVVLGSAGRPRRGDFATRVGQRVPVIPPLGGTFMAWSDDARVEDWLARAGDGADPSDYRQMLKRVRERGWSIALRSSEQIALEAAVGEYDPERADTDGARRLEEAASRLGSSTYEPEAIVEHERYDVRTITAPIFDTQGEVVLTLALYGLQPGSSGKLVLRLAADLRETCARLSA